MDFLKNNRRIDFLYSGIPFFEHEYKLEQVQIEDSLTTKYIFADGLVVTNIATKKGDAYEWVNWFENTSDKPTGVISQLYDACVTLPMPLEKALRWTAYQPEIDDITMVYAPAGSNWRFDEFASFADRKDRNKYLGHLSPTNSKEFSSTGGRSSEGNAPFFNVHKDGKGYIFAIGWTGQWNCNIARTEENIIVKTKIEDTNFRIMPGEKFRTSSFVLMPYECSVLQSQNKWRKLIREHYSLIGQSGRDSHAPLCAEIWGGMATDAVLQRIDAIKKYELPYEYIWMDAGWYGADTLPTPDEFEGDWASHTGDWQVSPQIHPNKLKDVSKATHDAGMKFLLWFEPERVRVNTPIVAEHPEYFVFPENEDEQNLLLNLGNEEAWNYIYNMLSGLIEDIGVDCYRQDFNFAPLAYWRKNDTQDRLGITEIKHINGLYRFWDALLQKFPHLIIDNCASGGKRLDVETLRRSIPLWRSDYHCPANFPAEGPQCHNLSFNEWMPFSGTSSGRIYDTYRIRSVYAPAMTTNYSFSQRENFGDDPEKMHWLKKQLMEYLEVRSYMNEDFYPLTTVSDRRDVWCAAQFDRPSNNDGIIQVFRRDESPYENARFSLYNIDKTAKYIFIDADDNSEAVLSGDALYENGFGVELSEKHSSKIYFYKKC